MANVTPLPPRSVVMYDPDGLPYETGHAFVSQVVAPRRGTRSRLCAAEGCGRSYSQHTLATWSWLSATRPAQGGQAA